jgi:hypothetical protein
MNACWRSASAIARVSCADTLRVALVAFALRLLVGLRLATRWRVGATTKVSPLGLRMVTGNDTLGVWRFHALVTLTTL